MTKIRDLQSKIFERINPVVRFSVTRYVFAIGVFVAIFAFGLISLLNLGVDLFPSINFPFVVVSTTYQGASPSVMDQQVTQVIENAVSTLSGITDLNSTSSNGLSIVMMSFDGSTDQNSAANQVASLVSAAVRRLPQGIGSPLIQTFNPSSIPIMQFGISGSGASLGEIDSYVANELTPLLERVSGVANIQVNGGPERQFQVLLNPNRLQSYGLSPQAVVGAIAASAVDQPIGTINRHDNALTFATENIPADVNKVADTLVDPIQGVRVGDVAAVRDLPVSTSYARVNGKPVVLVSLQQTSTSNAVAVVNNVRTLLDRTKMPAGYQVDYSNDTTASIRASLDSTYREIAITAAVVALIVLLFLGKLNTAFSVILAVPIALSATPILYNLMGFTLNLVSMLAMIVAIGIVVDDSIVVAENVERYRAMGFSQRESVLKGASEIFSAVVAATLSLLSVLIPVSFIGGIIGDFLRQFALGLAAAVAFSLLEAVLFLTVRLAYTPESARTLDWRDLVQSFGRLGESMKWGLRAWRKAAGILIGIGAIIALAATKNLRLIPAILLYPLALGLLRYLGLILLAFFQALTTTLHGWTEAGLEWVRDGYAKSLVGLIDRSVVVLLATAIALVLAVVLLVPKITFSFAPKSDSGTITINLAMHSGSTLESTNHATGALEAFLLGQPEVRTVQTIVGSTGSFTVGSGQPENTTMVVQLVALEKRAGVYSLMDKYRINMGKLLAVADPSATLSLAASGGPPGANSTITLNLLSSDQNILLDRNAKILRLVQGHPFVIGATSSLSNVSIERDFKPIESQMQGSGFTPSAIANLLQTYASGTQAGNVQIGGQSYPIMVKIDPTNLSDGQSLMNLPIYSPALRSSLQVGQLGSIAIRQSPINIQRYNRLYTTTLSITLAKNAPPAMAFQNSLTDELTKQGLLDDKVTLGSGGVFGASALAGQVAKTGITAFLLAIFLAYLVMASQFNSWRYPIYLLLPVPLAIVGALVFVVLLGGGLDTFGVLGMLLLIGLSAKNAILYLDFVVERIGIMPLKDALIEAARLRFRPIIMTTLTVLVISGPLVFGRGQGTEFGQRLGVVMFGGIISSAILTFFVVPAAFYLFEKGRVVFEPVKDEAGSSR
ncbi:MAG: efflux RND transporter permease subunit [Rectinemataceae bacterium]|jgi:HAE1 family hydrophobic/amphiphilic exporter-1